ncbi:hypothetical protein JK359_29635 [Streptomyces actinomycinicus]|uniref:ISAs1 family transposase n=1 Tax=Streptomyces actinomycinicus TaxID=1695166 RepID=A0A937EQ32_9ACTN|nr:hypothetical protein [Streptomyces actinomycinicus]MBL1086075.1 hypothetical protein [Streptomyces actinomycinicus]
MPAQREMRHEPHETLHFTAALDLIHDINSATVIADALHTVADHSRHPHRRGTFGLFPVKENRSALFAPLDALTPPAMPARSAVPVRPAGSGRSSGGRRSRTAPVTSDECAAGERSR